MVRATIPEADLTRIRQWIDARNAALPQSARADLRNELDVADLTVTIFECRPPWRPHLDPEWTRSPIARLRYTKSKGEWSLYWCDSNLKFHEYELVPSTPDVGALIAEIDSDPTSIFWG